MCTLQLRLLGDISEQSKSCCFSVGRRRSRITIIIKTVEEPGDVWRLSFIFRRGDVSSLHVDGRRDGGTMAASLHGGKRL